MLVLVVPRIVDTTVWMVCLGENMANIILVRWPHGTFYVVAYKLSTNQPNEDKLWTTQHKIKTPEPNIAISTILFFWCFVCVIFSAYYGRKCKRRCNSGSSSDLKVLESIFSQSSHNAFASFDPGRMAPEHRTQQVNFRCSIGDIHFSPMSSISNNNNTDFLN